MTIRAVAITPELRVRVVRRMLEQVWSEDRPHLTLTNGQRKSIMDGNAHRRKR